jgi:hypothetical protein
MKIFKSLEALEKEVDDLGHVDRGFLVLLCQISKRQVSIPSPFEKAGRRSSQ